jgi:hypothetical protein
MRKALVILVALALLMGTQIVVANAALDTSRRLFGGPSDHDVARGIFVDSNYIYIAGRTRSTGTGTWDLFLAIFNRADNSLRCIRAVDIGGADDYGQAVVAYTSGGVTHAYVIGYTDYGANPSNVLVVKFDTTTNCNVLDAKVYDVDGSDQPFGLTISPDGYLYIAGMSSSAAHLLKVKTSDLSIEWARRVSIAGVGDSANSVTISGNKLYVTGRTVANDLFVARFDAAGNLEVYKIFSSLTLQFEEGRDIVVAGGKVYVAGIHQLPTGNQEFLFMKLDPNTLNLELAKAFGTPGVEDIFSLSMVGGLAYAVGYTNHFGSFDVVLFAVNPLTGVLSHAFVLGDSATNQAAYDSASTGTCLIYTGATNGWPLSYRVLDLDEVNDATIGFSTPSGSPSSNLVTPTSISFTLTTPPFMPGPSLPNYDAFYSWFCPDALVVSTTTTSTVLTTSTLSTTVTSVVGTTTVYDVRTTTITQTSVTTTTSSTTTTLTQTATTTRTETTTLTQSTTYSTTYSTTTTLSTTLTYSTTTTLSTTTTSTQYFAEPVSTYVLPALLAVIAALLAASMVVGRRRRALPY